VRPPPLGWVIFVAGIIAGAVLVDLSGWIQAAPFRADARIWKAVATDSAKCSDRSGKLFNPRAAEPFPKH
jgi:hypothetical protein